MNISSALQNALYFIPVVGTIHHSREMYKLACEYDELIEKAPLIKDLSGYNTISAKIKNDKAFDQLNTLSPALKTRATKYFENKNQIDQLAAWGSIVQVIICVAAQALNPAFLILGKIECVHMLYSYFTLATGPNLYHYDSVKEISEIHRRDLMGESLIFGKSIVPKFDPATILN